MTEPDGFWIFQVPNMLLAIAVYTLLGRYILSLFFAHDSDRVIWRSFRQLTDPILNAVGAVTPRVVPPPLLVLLAVVWLMMARLALFLAVRHLGLLPSVTE